MKWGAKHANGCKVSPCPRAHPVMCIKSLDLKCLDRNCPLKLHTIKCVRWKAPSDGYRPGAGAVPGGVPWGIPGASRGEGVPNPWNANAVPRGSSAPHRPQERPNQNQNSDFYNMTVQQMLGAQQTMFQDMMVKFQQQMRQELHQHQASYLAPGPGGYSRPFSFAT